MGRPGRIIVQKILPDIRKTYGVDIVVAQAENISHGVGLRKSDYNDMRKAGIDFFSGGNHSVERKETLTMLADENLPVIAPINMHQTPSPGYKFLQTNKGKVAFISLLGNTFPKGMLLGASNPLVAVDEALKELQEQNPTATIVNFHGDVSSEKVMTGYYLDGRVAAVLGDHWHVPSADARVLPKGTAHVSDVGMCGVLHSSLGVKLSATIPRWRDGVKNTNILESKPPYQFNAVLVDINEQTGLSRSIERIQKIIETV